MDAQSEGWHRRCPTGTVIRERDHVVILRKDLCDQIEQQRAVDGFHAERHQTLALVDFDVHGKIWKGAHAVLHQHMEGHAAFR